MTAWDELIDEFRALGGTADNIRLGQGEYGRGLFPIDPAKPVVVRVPDNLLVPVDYMLCENGVRVGPKAQVGERERAWLDRYQAEFAWGGGGADEIRRIFETAQLLPAELRHVLSTQYRCGLWFKDPDDRLVANRFFNARSISYRDRPVVMPLIEMANHGSGANYDTSSGIALRGTFAGEVLVEYSQFDSFDFFLSWGFATQRPLAFSVSLNGSVGSAPLAIDQAFGGKATSQRAWIPELRKTAQGIALPFLMLGHQRFPRLAKGIFYRLMREGGYTGWEEAFDLVHHTNRLHFVNLLMALDGIDLPMARTLRTVAHYQLRAMSFCFGVHEI